MLISSLQPNAARGQLHVAVCTPIEAFAYLLAALCVDVDHNGVDNSYHCKQGTPLAVQCKPNGKQEASISL